MNSLNLGLNSTTSVLVNKPEFFTCSAMGRFRWQFPTRLGQNWKMENYFENGLEYISLKILRYLLKNFAFDMSMSSQEALLHDPKNKMFQRASEPDEFRSGFFQRHWLNKIPKFQLLHQKNCLQIDLNLQRIPEIKNKSSDYQFTLKVLICTIAIMW